MKRLVYQGVLFALLSSTAAAESSNLAVVGLEAEKIMTKGSVLAQTSNLDEQNRVRWNLLVSYEGRVWDCAWFWDGPGSSSIVQGCFRAK